MSYIKQIFEKGQTLMAEDLNKMSEGVVSKGRVIEVDELPMPHWEGTAITEASYCEKIYINSKLKVTEVTKILTKLPYDSDGMYTIASVENSVGLGVRRIDDLYEILYAEPGSITTIFFSKNQDDGAFGWRDHFDPDNAFPNPIEINGELTAVGSSNDILSSCISSTPFEYVKPNIETNSIYKKLDCYKIDSYTQIYDIMTEEELAQNRITVTGEVVDALPEVGVDFYMYMLEHINDGNPIYMYYVIPENECYCYVGEYVYTEFGLEAPGYIPVESVCTLMFGNPGIYGGIINNVDKALNSSQLYVLINKKYKYYNYNSYNDTWSLLNESAESASNKPHLYEHYVTLSSPDYTGMFEIHFCFLDNKINDWNDFHNILPILANTDTGSDFYAAATGYYKEGFVEDGTIKQITAIRVVHGTGTVYLYNSEGGSVYFSSTTPYNYTYTYGGYRQIY